MCGRARSRCGSEQRLGASLGAAPGGVHVRGGRAVSMRGAFAGTRCGAGCVVQARGRAGSRCASGRGPSTEPDSERLRGRAGTRTKTPLAPAPGRRPAAHELTEELIEIRDNGGPQRFSRTVNSSSRGEVRRWGGGGGGGGCGWCSHLRACRAPQDHALSDVGRVTANTQSFRHPIWNTPPHPHPTLTSTLTHPATLSRPPGHERALLERSVKGKCPHPGRRGCKRDGRSWEKIQKVSWPWDKEFKDQESLRDGNANGKSAVGERNLNWKPRGFTKFKGTADPGGQRVE